MTPAAAIAIIIFVLIIIVAGIGGYMYFGSSSTTTTPPATNPPITGGGSGTLPPYTPPASTSTPPSVAPKNTTYRAPYGEQKNDAWITMTGKSWSGNDSYTNPNTADFASCGVLARSMGSITATYDPTSKNCWVKKPTNADGTFGMLNPGTGGFIRQSGDFPGHDLPGTAANVADLAACEKLCWGLGNCEGYFFSNSDKRCYPKIPDNVSSGMVSGVFMY